MKLGRLVEARIQEARARGELDDLPGAGQPLPDDDLAGLPREERLAARVLRSGRAVPEEVRLLKELETLRAEREHATDERERSRLADEIGRRELRLALLLEAAGRNVSAGRIVRPER